MRGAASCNLAERVLEVPLGLGATERVVRAHELMHARVSPHAHHLARSLDEVSARALECAEEFRVNTLLARLRFDVDVLRDGTEKLGGRRVAEAEVWPEAVCFLVAVLGTGAEKEYVSGIRQGCGAWLPALRAIRKRALAIFDQPTATLAATRLNGDGLPSGYAASTLVLARVLTQTMDARVPTTPEELRVFRRSLESGARRPATGRFASLVLDDAVERTRRAGSRSVRGTRASTSGTVLRSPGRLVSVCPPSAESWWRHRHRSIGFDGRGARGAQGTPSPRTRGARARLQPSPGRSREFAQRVATVRPRIGRGDLPHRQRR